MKRTRAEQAAPETNQENASESGPEDDRLKEFEKQNYKYVEDKGDPSKIQTTEEIAQRKIVKIKRKIQAKPVDPSDKNVEPQP